MYNVTFHTLTPLSVILESVLPITLQQCFCYHLNAALIAQLFFVPPSFARTLENLNGKSQIRPRLPGSADRRRPRHVKTRHGVLWTTKGRKGWELLAARPLGHGCSDLARTRPAASVRPRRPGSANRPRRPLAVVPNHVFWLSLPVALTTALPALSSVLPGRSLGAGQGGHRGHTQPSRTGHPLPFLPSCFQVRLLPTGARHCRLPHALHSRTGSTWSPLPK